MNSLQLVDKLVAKHNMDAKTPKEINTDGSAATV
jgi:hypothetical protein